MIDPDVDPTEIPKENRIIDLPQDAGKNCDRLSEFGIDQNRGRASSGVEDHV